MTSTLTIAVEPSIEVRDHQARLLIDGKDMLGPEFSGLDPPMLKAELVGKGVGTLLVGRCWCGLLRCHDLKVEVTRTESEVQWSGPGKTRLSFDAAQYDAELARFDQDRSWESIGRTVEREIEPLFRGTTIKGGLAFQWASTRIEKGVVHLLFSKDHRHKRLKFKWDGARVADAVNQAKLLRQERFPHCK